MPAPGPGRFEGRTVLITGAARGQGAEEARRLVSEGARVLVTDVLDEEGRALAGELGPSAAYCRLDVTREEDWERALGAAGDRLDGLVNNAAYYRPNSLREASAAEFSTHMMVNQLGVFLGMKCAAPLIEAAGGGSIVNVSSTAGLKGSPRAIAYSASKWAVRGMTKAAAVDLAAVNIRVNSIHPGPVATPMLDVFTPEQRRQRMGLVPLKREGTVAEVAALVLFLLSDDAAFITGAEIAIDGGITL